MKAREMKPGRQYKLLGNTTKPQVVEYDRPSNGDGFAIVHPLGEPDMQSSFGVSWDHEVEEVPETGD